MNEYKPRAWMTEEEKKKAHEEYRDKLQEVMDRHLERVKADAKEGQDNT